MKNLLFLLFTVFTFYLKAQSISLNNNSGTNSITCLTPSINMTASCIGFSTASTFTWSSISSLSTGSNVNINSAGIYTAMIWSGNAMVVQTFTIYQNTTPPVSSITSTSLPIGGSIVPTVTLTAINPTTNVRHEVYSPTGGTFVVTSTTATYSANSPGTYTHCTISEINGCRTCQTFTLFLTTSIKEYAEENSLKIYHDISGDVIIKSTKTCSLSLIDIYGRCVKNIFLNDNLGYQIRLTDLESGVYLLVSEAYRKKIKFTVEN